jgi:ABC-type branched-subunit amino acid transport system substrate-binding protein
MPPASPSAGADAPLKAGAIFMFSGGVAELGQDSFDGANAALHLVNDEAGVGRSRVEWVKAEANCVIR